MTHAEAMQAIRDAALDIQMAVTDGITHERKPIGVSASRILSALDSLKGLSEEDVSEIAGWMSTWANDALTEFEPPNVAEYERRCSVRLRFLAAHGRDTK